MAQAVKTAISVPGEKFRKAELLRKKTGESRSALYTKALDALFSSLAVRELEEKYAAGYRAHPEDIGDINAVFKASLPVVGRDKW